MKKSIQFQLWFVLLLLKIEIPVQASYGPKVVSCWKNWLKMTDSNYFRALERYDRCGELVGELTGEIRERYRKSLVDNLQKSSNYFFDHTEMSPAEVIRVLRSANNLMETWTKGKSKDCSKCFDQQETESPEDYEERSEPASDGSYKWFLRTKLLFYAFIVLICVQSLFLLLLFCKVCCTDLLTQFPSCSYETECCCEEDKEWITQLISDCEYHLNNQQSECYPLLLDGPPREVKSVTAVGYGTNIGKRGNKEEELLTDLTPLSSPRIGSDSEFEALMSRKPLRKQRRPK